MTETDPQIEHIQITFEVFCKSVLKNKARSIHRKLNNIESREYPLSDFLTVPNLTDVKEDTYQLDDPITFEVKGQVIHVLDRELAQGIKSLVPKYRDVLLLSFFADCSDMEISRVLNIPVSTVRPRREAAIRRMRERIPNPMNNDLLDYKTIIRAVSGDTNAISSVLKHFEHYITKLSQRYLTTPDGNRQLVVDEDIKRELEIELITKIHRFHIPE